MEWSVHNSLEVTVMCHDYILSSKMRFKPAMTIVKPNQYLVLDVRTLLTTTRVSLTQSRHINNTS